MTIPNMLTLFRIFLVSLLALWGLFMWVVMQPRQRARYLAPIVCFSSASVLVTMIYFMANVPSYLPRAN